MDSVILTKRGWLSYDEVGPGDETIGYNPATGRSEWTRILRVVHHDDAEVWRIGNKYWHADVTPNHRWWSDTMVRVQPVFERCPECGWVPGPGVIRLWGTLPGSAAVSRFTGTRSMA